MLHKYYVVKRVVDCIVYTVLFSVLYVISHLLSPPHLTYPFALSPSHHLALSSPHPLTLSFSHSPTITVGSESSAYKGASATGKQTDPRHKDPKGGSIGRTAAEEEGTHIGRDRQDKGGLLLGCC